MAYTRSKRKAANGKGPGRKALPANQRKSTQAVTLTPSEAQQVRDEIEIRVKGGEIRMTESEMSRHLIRIGLSLLHIIREGDFSMSILDSINEHLLSQEALSK